MAIDAKIRRRAGVDVPQPSSADVEPDEQTVPVHCQRRAAALGCGPVIPAMPPGVVAASLPLSRSAIGRSGATGVGASATVAKLMVDAGLLCDGDWAGTWETTVTQALRRYIERNIPGIDLDAQRETFLTLGIANSYETTIGLCTYNWSTFHGGAGREDPGMLCLDGNGTVYTVPWQPIVKAINRVWPGLGYEVVCLFNNAVNDGSFAWASDWILEMDYDDAAADMDDEEQLDLLTLDNFYRSVPVQLCKWGCDIAKIEDAVADAQRRRPGTAARKLLPFLEDCVTLWRSMQGITERVDETCFFGDGPCCVPSYVFQWAPNDWMSRVLDDYGDLIQENENTTLVWSTGFWTEPEPVPPPDDRPLPSYGDAQPWSTGTFEAALKRMLIAVEHYYRIEKCVAVIDAYNDAEIARRTARANRPKGKTLARVFAGEEHAEEIYYGQENGMRIRV